MPEKSDCIPLVFGAFFIETPVAESREKIKSNSDLKVFLLATPEH